MENEQQKQELQKNPGCAIRIPFLPQILVFAILLGSPSWYANVSYIVLAILSLLSWIIFVAIFMTLIIMTVARNMAQKHDIVMHSSQPITKEQLDTALSNIAKATSKWQWWLGIVLHGVILYCIMIEFHQLWLVKYYLVFLLLHIAKMHSIDEMIRLIHLIKKQKFGA